MTSAAPPEAGVQPGDVLAGKYLVDRVLGEGGMGVVVAAHHVQLDTKVAIKFLLPQMLVNPEATSRFAREARAAVRITSEHVARVIDVGNLENGAPYMVMEFLEGGDLSTWVRQRGVLPTEQAVEFVLQACVAVAEAHVLGIVHRDIKPANLFCIRRPDGLLSIKVLDFGISKMSEGARASEAPGLSVTKTTEVLGSPLYMSPEQMQSSKSVTSQSDIWALGVTLFELLAGRTPYEGEGATDIAIKVATQPPAPLRAYRPDVPDRLEAIVLRCLEKDRLRRYANVAELAMALAEFAPPRAGASVERITGTIRAAGLAASPPELPPAARMTDPIGSPTSAPFTQTTGMGAVRSSGRAGAVLAVALAVVVVGGAGMLLARRGQETSSASATTEPTVSAAAPASATASASAEATSPSTNPTTLASATTSPQETNPASSTVAAASARWRPAARPRPAGRGPASYCDPNYTLDDQGRKHFKPECFLNK
ncbi:MAG TPA: serine/threonine-protein kinase [Polyangiaceae bacterium]